MMNEMDPYGLHSSHWAEVNPSRCPCRGSGWMLSAYDTAEPCHRHPDKSGDFHPDAEGASEEAGAERMLRINREAFVAFRDAAMAAGVRSRRGFVTLCRRKLEGNTPADWVNAAEAVAEEFRDSASRRASAAADRRAQAEGFACALDRSWAMDAEAEAQGVF